nr:hypothetical protein Iba_chr02bCG10660 [Ipomoea batatas]GMC74344.1 hypothetical protein Iba_chr03cCG9350 [Ipomoea batatas]
MSLPTTIQLLFRTFVLHYRKPLLATSIKLALLQFCQTITLKFLRKIVGASRSNGDQTIGD